MNVNAKYLGHRQGSAQATNEPRTRELRGRDTPLECSTTAGIHKLERYWFWTLKIGHNIQVGDHVCSIEKDQNCRFFS